MSGRTEGSQAYPVVEIESGKVRGRNQDGVNIFRGVPYGASTAGARRFKPPEKPAPWAGIRDCLALGPQAPQPTKETYVGSTELDLVGGSLEVPPLVFSEDCLVLNVWSPAARLPSRRPVMVWLHGGGFSYGSGGGSWYDGANLCRKGDVIVITLNHRLHGLGFLYLDEANPDFFGSGNAGMLDIVLALEWIRDNIAVFGGDPDNVTIFGQSGGGSKVSVLLAMPAAKGLFHKSIVMSGVLSHAQRAAGPAPEKAQVAEMVLKELGCSARDAAHLHQIPVAQLFDAIETVRKSIDDRYDMRTASPVIDGHTLPALPFFSSEAMPSGDVPMMIGTARDEASFLLGEDAFSLNEAKLVERVSAFVGADHATAAALVDRYRSLRNYARPTDLYTAIATDHMFRMDALHQADRKAEMAAAPVYMYRVDWEAQGFGGRYKATHGVEVPAVFDNFCYARQLGGSLQEQADFAEMMSRAWSSFAHSGNPNHAGIPLWPSYSAASRPTMIFNRESYVANDPDRIAREARGTV